MAENPYVKINGIFKKLKIAESEQLCLYIHAPVGFGKTAAVRNYYRDQQVCYLSGRKGFLSEMPSVSHMAQKVIVADDISWITDELSQEYIRALITNREKHVVLIGRNKLPKWLMNEYLSGLLLMADEKDLVMDEAQTAKLAEAYAGGGGRSRRSQRNF